MGRMTDENLAEAIAREQAFWTAHENREDALDAAFEARRHWPSRSGVPYEGVCPVGVGEQIEQEEEQ